MSNGVTPGAVRNPKPPPDVVMEAFDALPPRVRDAIRQMPTDVDPRRIREMIEDDDYTEDEILTKLARHAQKMIQGATR